MVKKIYFTVFLFYTFCFFGNAQKVGINVDKPDYMLDVRGTDDVSIGADLQLATPSQTDFLRFFSGRLGDRNPFMAFHDLDTFHFVTTLPDFSTYMRRMTILPNGKVGMGTDKPESELDIRTFQTDDGAEMHLSNSTASHFLRFFSGKPTNERPAIFWNFGSTLDFARFDDNLDYRPFLSLDGKTIAVLNNNSSVYLGENAGTMGSGFGNTAIGGSSLQNKTIGAQNTALGFGAGNGTGSTGSTVSGNVLIGYEAGYNINQSNRLFIENSSSAIPLIYGEFDNNLFRINGRQEITGELNLSQGITTGVALRVNGQEALWSDGNYFSYGFGTDYNYFAKPVRVGPTEGNISPYADLHVLDNVGISNVSIESYSNDAILQLSGSTNAANTHWTIRRRNLDGHLEWKHNNLSFMRLTTTGKLGIGVTNPQKTIEIAGDSKFFKAINSISSSPLFVTTIENTSNTNTFYNNGLEIRAGHDNFVGGTAFPLQPIFIGFYRPDGTTLGGIHQSSANGLIFYELSDRRYKREILTTRTGIKTLMKIKVRDYKWNEGNRNQQATTGFIAQELHKVYPSAARKGGSDSKSDPWQIAPTKLIPLMVKSIQDQQDEIETLRKENEDLISRIERLESLVERKMK